MKGGINYSDKVTTVSETYANEIQTPEYGETLDGLLRCRSYALKGIVNGIDYEEYDPNKDKLIFERYSVNNIKGKKANKKQLQQ